VQVAVRIEHLDTVLGKMVDREVALIPRHQRDGVRGDAAAMWW
jgi:hypothetical protein